ncbi:cytochrome P450 monooxygenase 2 [Microdochium nivale]|nr:cytochrome P450 monooxygenase 2 [Microdochium nivale]
MGEITILPSHWASHIRNNRDFSLNEVLRVDNYCGLPGFEPYTAGFADDGLLLVVARKHLAKHLDDLNKYISVEASDALDKNLGQSFEWRELQLKQVMLNVVSQGLACAFLGSEHCRNKEWLQLSEEYLLESVAAAANLRMYPQWLVNISHWYLPSCRKLRGTVAKARSILNPIVEKRRKIEKNGSDAAPGLKAPDSIDWFEEEADGRPYDLAAFQLLLSLAGIHATSDLLNEMLLRLAQDPSLVQDARAEIIKVLPSHGFTKAGLYQMMLLDSILKESLRLRADFVQMNRIALCDTKLPEGITIRRGQRVTVDAAPMYSADTYEDPMCFDGRRFLRMRSQPGLEGAAQSTGVGPTFLAWGYGTHACPGRFFVSNQVKVTLVHFIMKYDFMLPEGYRPGIQNYGINRVSDPKSRILLRRRTPEIDVDSLYLGFDSSSNCNVSP